MKYKLSTYKLDSNIELCDLSVYLIKEKVLIFSDFHIGYEEALNKQGILVPRLQFDETTKRLDKILYNYKGNLNKIIINGDIKHEFGVISETEWRQTLKIIDMMKKYCKDIILVRGNHDKILGPIATKRNIPVTDKICFGKILIIHGDKIINEYCSNSIKNDKIKLIIIGHEHPAVSIIHENRSEKFKCFIYGNYKRKKLLVIPSFNMVTEGTDILKEKLLSPYLHHNLSKFNVFVVDYKIYDFGTINLLKRMS